MKKIFFFNLVWLLLFTHLMPAQSNDYFPLSVGSYFKYQYSSTDYYSDMGMYVSQKNQSGVVIFNILSSVKTDSSINWSVKETDSIYTESKIIFNGETDTSYYSIESTTFTLFESLDSLHKLKASSNLSGIWDSPTNWHPPSIGYVTGLSINRYSSINYLSQHNFIMPVAFGDSLLFESKIGLTKASSYFNKGPIEIYEYHWIADLVDDSIATDIKKEIIPANFYLYQNYPNPFNPNTVISYSLPSGSILKLTVYNALGQIVKVLDKGFKNAGNYSVTFNASNIPSGIYFYKLESGQFTQVKKMILIK
jgi:hypothetical protein